MANFIIKKDGSKEPFNLKKIENAVIAAAAEAGFADDLAAKLSQDISNTIKKSTVNLNEVLGVEIRARALSQLDAIAPAVAESWRKFENKNSNK